MFITVIINLIVIASKFSYLIIDNNVNFFQISVSMMAIKKKLCISEIVTVEFIFIKKIFHRQIINSFYCIILLYINLKHSNL